MTDHLNALGRKPGIKDWQFRQGIDAIQILLVDMAGLDKAGSASMGRQEVLAFLEYLALGRKVSPIS